MMSKRSATLVLLPHKRSWKERQRVDLRKRERDRSGYKRPDAGKRPRTHSVPVVKKEARFEELEEKRKKEALMHGQLASLSTAADDWNDTEVGEESEMDSQHDLQECRTSPTKPRWLDEQTEIPKKEYYKIYYKENLDTLEYGVWLPHRSPNCGMTTTFGDLCDFLCEPLKRAPSVREKRQELAASAKLPMGIQMQLYATLAVKKEQDVALEQLRKFVWDYRMSIFMRTFLAELPLTLKRLLGLEKSTAWLRNLQS